MSHTKAAGQPNVRKRLRPHQGPFLPEYVESIVGGQFLALEHLA